MFVLVMGHIEGREVVVPLKRWLVGLAAIGAGISGTEGPSS